MDKGDTLMYIICTPNLSRVIKVSEQADMPKIIKELKKEKGTKRLQIFCRAGEIEKYLKDKKIL